MAISVANSLNEVSNLQKQKDEMKSIEEKRAKEKAEEARAQAKARDSSESSKAAMTESGKGKKFDKNA